MLNINHLAGVVAGHRGYTVVGIPGHLHHQTVEYTLRKVRTTAVQQVKKLLETSCLHVTVFL